MFIKVKLYLAFLVPDGLLIAGARCFAYGFPLFSRYYYCPAHALFFCVLLQAAAVAPYYVPHPGTLSLAGFFPAQQVVVVCFAAVAACQNLSGHNYCYCLLGFVYL